MLAEVSQAWLSSPGLCYDGVAADSGVEAVDGDFLAAAIAFVEAAVGSCGGGKQPDRAASERWMQVSVKHCRQQLLRGPLPSMHLSCSSLNWAS